MAGRVDCVCDRPDKPGERQMACWDGREWHEMILVIPLSSVIAFQTLPLCEANAGRTCVVDGTAAG